MTGLEGPDLKSERRCKERCGRKTEAERGTAKRLEMKWRERVGDWELSRETGGGGHGVESATGEGWHGAALAWDWDWESVTNTNTNTTGNTNNLSVADGRTGQETERDRETEMMADGCSQVRSAPIRKDPPFNFICLDSNHLESLGRQGQPR